MGGDEHVVRIISGRSYIHRGGISDPLSMKGITIMMAPWVATTAASKTHCY